MRLRLQLLRELVSELGSIGVLINPDNPNAATDPQDLRDAAETINMKLAFLEARTPDEITQAFAGFAAQKLKAVLVNTDPYYLGRRDHLAELAASHSLPAIYSLREHVAAGGLISYGASLSDAYRQAGIYLGRILKGEKLAELPIVQPTKFDLVINLKTAKVLGLKIPDRLLALADDVIE